MPKFKNVSPLGALDIPALGRVVQAGEVFESPGEFAEYFAQQPDNFEAVVPAPRDPKETKAAAKAPKPRKPRTVAERDAAVAPAGDGDTTTEDTDEQEGDR